MADPTERKFKKHIDSLRSQGINIPKMNRDELEDDFESKSMFSPNNDEELDDGEGSIGLGSNLRQRQTNENYYNLEHALDSNKKVTGGKKLDLMIENINKYKKDQFNKAKEEQQKISKMDRLPYYYDQEKHELVQYT